MVGAGGGPTTVLRLRGGVNPSRSAGRRRRADARSVQRCPDQVAVVLAADRAEGVTLEAIARLLGVVGGTIRDDLANDLGRGEPSAGAGEDAEGDRSRDVWRCLASPTDQVVTTSSDRRQNAEPWSSDRVCLVGRESREVAEESDCVVDEAELWQAVIGAQPAW